VHLDHPWNVLLSSSLDDEQTVLILFVTFIFMVFLIFSSQMRHIFSPNNGAAGHGKLHRCVLIFVRIFVYPM